MANWSEMETVLSGNLDTGVARYVIYFLYTQRRNVLYRKLEFVPATCHINQVFYLLLRLSSKNRRSIKDSRISSRTDFDSAEIVHLRSTTKLI